MKKHLLSLAFTLGSLIAISQAPAIQWQKSLGGTLADKGNSIRQTTDGGYIIAGETNSNDGDVTGYNGGPDYWVTRLDANGVLVWQKSLGGSSDDRANDVVQATDGGYLVVGTSNSGVGGNITAVKGLYDFWVVKLTSTGTISWQKNIGGTNYEEAHAVQQTSDGGYIIAGDAKSTNFDLTANNGGFDFWVVKIDALGVIQWQKNLGGAGNDNAYAVQQTSDGGYIVSGETSSTNGDVSGNNGGKDCWVVKLSSAGTLQWQKCLGGTGGDFSTSVKQTTDGGFIVAGKTDSNDGNVSGNNGAENVWLVKLTSTGTIDWQKCYGGNGFDGANDVQQTNDGGYIFVGEASSNTNDVSGNHGGYDFWAVKTTSTGVLSWQKCLGGSLSDVALSVCQTTDNGYAISGRSNSTAGDITGAKGGDDFWVVKLVGVPTPSVPSGINDSDLNNNRFVLFPNPTSGIVTLTNENPSWGIFTLRVSDALGRLVHNSKLSTQRASIDLSAANKGVYLLEVINDKNQTVTIKKLILN